MDRVEGSLDGIVVTGANGQLGRALLSELASRAQSRVRALVRSEAARTTIEALSLDPAPEILIVDYTSASDMQEAIADMQCVVHLVGIIKESPDARYVQAHEETCHALALAASRSEIERIIYVSILGAAADSDNDCLASKGRAATRLLDDRAPTTVLRVPMVLGRDDPASTSLRRQARSKSVHLVAGGRTRQQPIDSRDVIQAILAARTAAPGQNLALDVGGPECLTHRDLVLRAARLWQNEPRIRSIPLWLARFAVAVLGAVLRRPPITTTMFEILQRDDHADPEVLSKTLGIELTPFSKTLDDYIGPRSQDAGSENPS